MEYTLVTTRAKKVKTTERFIAAEKQIDRRLGAIYVPGKTVLQMTCNFCSNGHRMAQCTLIIPPTKTQGSYEKPKFPQSYCPGICRLNNRLGLALVSRAARPLVDSEQDHMEANSMNFNVIISWNFTRKDKVSPEIRHCIRCALPDVE